MLFENFTQNLSKKPWNYSKLYGVYLYIDLVIFKTIQVES
jgi:hypothetical protein